MDFAKMNFFRFKWKNKNKKIEIEQLNRSKLKKLNFAANEQLNSSFQVNVLESLKELFLKQNIFH